MPMTRQGKKWKTYALFGPNEKFCNMKNVYTRTQEITPYQLYDMISRTSQKYRHMTRQPKCEKQPEGRVGGEKLTRLHDHVANKTN